MHIPLPNGADRAALRAWLIQQQSDSPTLGLNWQDYLPHRNMLLTELVNQWECHWTPRWKARILPLVEGLAHSACVPLRRCAATNEHLSIDTLTWMLDNPDVVIEPSPLVVAYARRFYVLDGHHRIALTKALYGAKQITARVFSLNYYLRAYPIPAQVLENSQNGNISEFEESEPFLADRYVVGL